jgi:hypothetical protein
MSTQKIQKKRTPAPQQPQKDFYLDLFSQVAFEAG